MRALAMREPRTFSWTEVEKPTIQSADDVLVKVHRIGICGTDYAGYLGKMPFFSYPRIPGHELGVEVVEVGSASSGLRVGDRCSVEPYLNCQQCYACERGHTNCCESHRTLGVMCDGGMTDYVVLPARKLHRSEVLDYEQLALVETLGIGCHAVQRGCVTEKDTVLILGAGPIGLSALEFVRLAGGRPIVVDLNAKRLEFVRERMQIAETIQVDARGNEGVAERLMEMGSGRLADVVIDATGSAESMSRALELATFAGRVVYVGITQAELHFPHAPLLHRRELTLLASRNALAGDFRDIIRFMELGRIDTRPWISHRCPIDQVPERFPEWIQPESGVVKAMVSM